MFDINNWQIVSPSAENCLRLDQFIYENVSKIFSKEDINVIYVIDDAEALFGCISKGEFLKSTAENLIINTSPSLLRFGERLPKNSDIEKKNSLPIVDGSTKKIVKIIEKRKGQSPRKPVFIAEIGNNHQGDIDHALELINAAKTAGADYVKFQARDLSQLYASLDENFLRETDYATTYTVRQLQKYGLNFDQLSRLFDYCRAISIEPICTPFDTNSAVFLIEQKLNIIKIASADLRNFELLQNFNTFTGRILMSTGMHDFKDIRAAHDWAATNFVDVVLLHTNSTYPTPYSDINLKMMPELGTYSTSGLFGYSGHERGSHIPLAAVALGATYIEKHITFDREQQGNDHKVSLLPDEFAQMVRHSEELIESLGVSSSLSTRTISQGEALNQIALSKGVYAKRPLGAGDVVTRDDIELKSPCIGITPSTFLELSEFQLLHAIQNGEPLERRHFVTEYEFQASKGFGHYGIPCRVRDIEEIANVFEPKFLEYHLFSTDLELDLTDYKKKFRNKVFSFHAPEQFDDGFVLDLVSDDQAVKNRSLSELDRIIAWVLRATELSRQDIAPKLITNVGGASYSIDHELDKNQCFETLAVIDQKLSAYGIEFRPQTMPPFPWHFGGQGFHNLFVNFDDIVEAQKYFQMTVCLDLSHSWLSSSHLKTSFYNELEKIKNFVDYIHVADAVYPGEEGIQLGTGEIDFKKCFDILDVKNNKIMWIPEIWKGHMEHFKGFKLAMKYLEGII